MLGTDGLQVAAIEKDVRHLTGLSPSFASEVDLLLLASDGFRDVAYPVHKAVISQHSAVLSQALQDLYETSSSTSAQSLPQLPMVDDDCSAISSMLACMYGRFIYAGTPPAQTPTPTISLEMVPIHANKMRVPHKYSMADILLEQEKALLPALEELAMQSVSCCYTQQHALVLETAIVAEDCFRPQMLSICEAFIAKNLGAYMKADRATISKLSKASLIRVAQGVDRWQTALNTKLQKLQSYSDEAQQFNPFIKAHFEHGMICPRCNRHLDRSKKRNVVHKKRSSSCTWPKCSFEVKELSMMQIANGLLKLAKAAKSTTV